MKTRKIKGVMECIVEIDVRDKSGKLVQRRRFRSKSFVANMIKALRRLMIGVTSASSGTYYYPVTTGTEPVDTGGTARGFCIWAYTASSIFNILKADAGTGDVTHGIRVGTGSTAPGPTDYNLASPIAHGTGSGQMEHGTVSIDSTIIDGSQTYFRIVRTFTNSSGATITVREIALIIYTQISTSSKASIMLARDVLASAQDVLNGQTLTVRYIISVTT